MKSVIDYARLERLASVNKEPVHWWQQYNVSTQLCFVFMVIAALVLYKRWSNKESRKAGLSWVS